jgi:ABC-type enterochelin transport system permease subunit
MPVVGNKSAHLHKVTHDVDIDFNGAIVDKFTHVLAYPFNCCDSVGNFNWGEFAIINLSINLYLC